MKLLKKIDWVATGFVFLNLFILFALGKLFSISFLDVQRHLQYFLFAIGLVCSGFITFHIRKRIGNIAAITFFYFFFSMYWVFAFVQNRYEQEEVNYMFQLMIWNKAQQELIYYGLFVAAGLCLTTKFHQSLTNGFIAMNLIASLSVIGKAILGDIPYERGTVFLGNASLNACFIASTYPLLFRQKNSSFVQFFSRNLFIFMFIMLLPPIAIVLSHGSVAVGALLIMLLCVVLFFSERPFWQRVLSGVMTFVLGLSFTSLVFGFTKLFDSSSRITFWSLMLKDWITYGTKKLEWLYVLIGTGGGTFRDYAAQMQIRNKWGCMYVPSGPNDVTPWDCDVWYHAHSEWFQILFEQGILGVVIAATFCIWFLRKLYKKEEYAFFFATISTLSVSLFNYPLRDPIYAMFIAFLVASVALKRGSTRSETL